MASRVLLRNATAQARRAPSAAIRSSSSAVVEQPVTWNAGSAPIVPFVDGIPVAQARAITEREKTWVFWSTTNYGKKPSPGFINIVPASEQWVIESGGRFSKVAGPGWNVLLPFIHKVKAVKSVHGTTLGVLSRKAKSKTGDVDAYAVIYAKYSDLSKVSHHNSGSMDGELELVTYASKVMAEAVAGVATPLSESDRAALASKVKAGIANRAAELGLTVETVEFRDAWPVSAEVPDRLVALEKAPRPSWDHTHHLANDYWAQIMPPLFFTKFRYGNLREPETLATVGLEWNLPSPPEYHHYHAGLPKLVIGPEQAAELKGASSH
ncbi:hypothetical protein DFJ74DRAFT_687250 [Hyaloraphidium curvatum]|nr:hypothetical protein DFJ74DRAFT_687250 [Hyaloraphidium curvatum]